MIKSMTGYGWHEQTIDGRLIGVEIKSVNHRYLEFNARIPKSYGFLEGKLKSFVQSKLSRGKLDLTVSIETIGNEQVTVQINESLANGYVQALKKMVQQFALKEELDAMTIAGYPDVLTVQKTKEDEEKLWFDVKQVAQTALNHLLDMREQEGQNLKQDLLARAGCIEQLVGQIETRSPQTVEAYKERLSARVQELTNDQEFLEARLTMEVVLFADKTSVVEEIVRLHSHVNQLRSMLESANAVGRKLDFLVQEMNREANTIGSKAMDTQIAYMVVDVKAEIEKIREQIQNIE